MEVWVLHKAGLRRKEVQRAGIAGAVERRPCIVEVGENGLRKRLNGVWVDVVRAGRHDGLLS